MKIMLWFVISSLLQHIWLLVVSCSGWMMISVTLSIRSSSPTFHLSRIHLFTFLLLGIIVEWYFSSLKLNIFLRAGFYQLYWGEIWRWGSIFFFILLFNKTLFSVKSLCTTNIIFSQVFQFDFIFDWSKLCLPIFAWPCGVYLVTCGSPATVDWVWLTQNCRFQRCENSRQFVLCMGLFINWHASS